MIRYLKHEDIDLQKWDGCIKQSFNGLIYGYSWFLDLVADNWDALVDEDYERVFPLTWRKKYGICYLHQPFFTQQLGIFSKTILTGEVVEQFINNIPERFRLVEINLNSHNKLHSSHYHVRNNLNHELDLIGPYEQLARSYSENTRRSIRKATLKNLSVMNDIRPDDVIDLFRANRGQTVRNLKEPDYKRFKRLVYTCIHKGKAQVWGVFSPENNLCAGAVFLFGHNKVIFLFSGIDAYGRSNGAMPFLIDSFIREHAQTHQTLDFEGSNDPSLARFYKSFGSTETHYPFIRINRLPLAFRILKKLQTAIGNLRTAI